LQHRVGLAGEHVAGQTLALVTVGREKVLLAAFLSDQYVRARDIRAARKVEADEGNLAGTGGGDAAATQLTAEITGQSRFRKSRIRCEQSRQSTTDSVSRARHEALCNELPACDRTWMVSMQLRRIVIPFVAFLSHGCCFL
jgi:hypothetical protein